MWAASSSSEVTSGGVRTCALEDREIDLDLIQPAGVDGKMHGHQVVVGILQAPDGGTPAVGATVVEHPKDMARGAIRFLGHDLTDEPAEWLDAGSQLQASEEFGPVDVPGRDVGQRAAPFVLMLASIGCRELAATVAWHRMRAWMEVFSSAEITNSSGWSSCPSNSRA